MVGPCAQARHRIGFSLSTLLVSPSPRFMGLAAIFALTCWTVALLEMLPFIDLSIRPS